MISKKSKSSPKSQTQKSPRCLLCGGADVRVCFSDPSAPSVKSDCKPWPMPAVTWLCRGCGHLQKAADPEAREKVNQVYEDYELYHLSAGAEQVIHGGEQGPRARSDVFLEKVSRAIDLPEKGRMLDVGCGIGVTLRAFGRRWPGWELAGQEYTDRSRQRVMGIPGVHDFWSGPLDVIKKRFDLIMMVHVLEHLPEPAVFLRQLRGLLAPGGRLLIQVPDILQNPFDMMIFDHYSHFSLHLLKPFAESQGFETVASATDWGPKECSLVLRVKDDVETDWCAGLDVKGLVEKIDRGGQWLKSVAKQARDLAGRGRFGIFGTAVAGTWLGAVVGERLAFFVDEDEQRLGKLHMGRPIIHPRDVKKGDVVYIAFPYELAKRIYDRLSKDRPGQYVLPPQL